MTRTCQREGCDKLLPRTAATQRKYCSGRCQRAESRRRAADTVRAEHAPEEIA